MKKGDMVQATITGKIADVFSDEQVMVTFHAVDVPMFTAQLKPVGKGVEGEKESNTALWEIVQAVAENTCSYFDGYDDRQCIFACNGEDDWPTSTYLHTQDCPHTKAQALVEQAQREKGKRTE